MRFTGPCSTVDIIDCTLRDGGYNNGWNFDRALVTRYLNALEHTGIGLVELGYRAIKPDASLGTYRVCSDELLRSHGRGRHLRFAVMLDAAPLLRSGSTRVFSVEGLLGRHDDSPIHMIRVATTIDLLESILPYCEDIKTLGYALSINIMQASALDLDAIKRAGHILRGVAADVVYLADSCGGLTPDTTRARVDGLSAASGHAVGFHAHDNLGLALANTIAATEAGATFVDSSVRGMGRGAGNTRTEHLLTYLTASGRHDLTAGPLYDLVTNDFATLQTRLEWGTTVPFLVSGAAGIHPRYVLALADIPHLPPDTVVAMLLALRTAPLRSTFRPNELAKLLAAHGVTPPRPGARFAGAKDKAS